MSVKVPDGFVRAVEEAQRYGMSESTVRRLLYGEFSPTGRRPAEPPLQHIPNSRFVQCRAPGKTLLTYRQIEERVMLFNRPRITSEQLAARIMETQNCLTCGQTKSVMHTVRVHDEWMRYCDTCVPDYLRPRVDRAAAAILTKEW